MKNNTTVDFEGFVLMAIIAIYFFTAPFIWDAIDGKKEAPTAIQEMTCEMEESIDSFVEDCLYLNLNGWRAEE